MFHVKQYERTKNIMMTLVHIPDVHMKHPPLSKIIRLTVQQMFHVKHPNLCYKLLYHIKTVDQEDVSCETYRTAHRR